MCWIGNRAASALFLALPMSVVLAANCVLYGRTVASIRHVSRLQFSQKKRGSQDLKLYARIFAILGTYGSFATRKLFDS